MRQALVIFEEQPTEDSLVIAALKMSLSQSLLAQDRMPEAEKIAVEAYDEVRQLFGQQSPRVKKASDNLIKIYQAEGKTDAAERLK